jgi:hypothetical protein
VHGPGQRWVKLKAITLTPGQTQVVGWMRLTDKKDAGWFWLLLHRQEGEEEPWYLVSDRPGQRRLIRLYKLRMWMEEMFGDMKGHRFYLQAAHLDDLHRLSSLVFASCLTFSWLITLGSWVVKNGYRHFLTTRAAATKAICASVGIGPNDVFASIILFLSDSRRTYESDMWLVGDKVLADSDGPLGRLGGGDRRLQPWL